MQGAITPRGAYLGTNGTRPLHFPARIEEESASTYLAKTTLIVIIGGRDSFSAFIRGFSGGFQHVKDYPS